MGLDRLRLGIAQMTSDEDPAANLARVDDLVRAAAAERADLVVFPENTLYFRITGGRPPRGPTAADLARLAELATSTKLPILLTTPSLDGTTPAFVNATWLFEPGGSPRVVYEKVHLFDVDVEGAPPVRESATFRAGRGPSLIKVGGWRIGLSICYDLRFAELYRPYAQVADLILVPSAFLVPTGRAHWHVLLRARAIEAQSFVAAPAQVGRHRSAADERTTFGHALVVDPWGTITSDQAEVPGLAVVELERAALARVRGQIPMADHRRLC